MSCAQLHAGTLSLKLDPTCLRHRRHILTLSVVHSGPFTEPHIWCIHLLSLLFSPSSQTETFMWSFVYAQAMQAACSRCPLPRCTAPSRCTARRRRKLPPRKASPPPPWSPGGPPATSGAPPCASPSARSCLKLCLQG